MGKNSFAEEFEFAGRAFRALGALGACLGAQSLRSPCHRFVFTSEPSIPAL